MKNNILLLLLLSTIFFIANVSAISPSSPTNISLSCGDYNYLSITGISTDVSNITNTKWIKPGLNVGMGFDFKNLLSGGNTLTAYFFTNTENCQPGSTSTTFNIGDEDYTINIEILKEEYKLGEKLLSVNEVLKIGKDISSPLIIPGEANLILGLEIQEALRAKRFANFNTIFLINEQFKQIQGSNLKPEKIKQEIQKISDKVNFIDATSITQKELGNPVVAGVFLLSYASIKGFIPISLKKIIQATKQVVGPKYFNLNKKAIELAKKY